MDVDHGFFMVKFDLEADKDKVIEGGPWMIFDHYLAVFSWTPNFVSTTAKVEKTLVWIRFPGMNLVFYDESLLLAMALAVGRPIKVDEHTLKVERGIFARVCVEINLNQPVVGKIFVKGMWYNVEYEGLHMLCGKCGCYGHVTRNYNQKIPPTVQVEGETTTPAPEGAPENSKAPMTQPSNPTSTLGVTTEFAALVIANDAIIEDSPTDVPKIKGPIHGEWLVVTRKKKNQQMTPKLKEKIKQYGPPNQPNKFDMLHESSNYTRSDPSNKPMAFNAGPLGTKEVETEKTPFNPKEGNW